MLVKALLVNCIFSICSGLSMLIFTDFFSKQIMLPNGIINILAYGLLAFAATLGYLANNIKVAKKLTLYVVIADIFWVLSTSILSISFLSDISNLGVGIVACVNIVVATLAFTQYRGLRQALDFNRT